MKHQGLVFLYMCTAVSITQDAVRLKVVFTEIFMVSLNIYMSGLGECLFFQAN